jgi:hypothetical protein
VLVKPVGMLGTSRPATWSLVLIALQVAGLVAAHFKQMHARPTSTGMDCYRAAYRNAAAPLMPRVATRFSRFLPQHA